MFSAIRYLNIWYSDPVQRWRPDTDDARIFERILKFYSFVNLTNDVGDSWDEIHIRCNRFFRHTAFQDPAVKENYAWYIRCQKIHIMNPPHPSHQCRKTGSKYSRIIFAQYSEIPSCWIPTKSLQKQITSGHIINLVRCMVRLRSSKMTDHTLMLKW